MFTGNRRLKKVVIESMVSAEQIKELLKYGEKINLECKKAETDISKKFVTTILIMQIKLSLIFGIPLIVKR